MSNKLGKAISLALLIVSAVVPRMGHGEDVQSTPESTVLASDTEFGAAQATQATQPFKKSTQERPSNSLQSQHSSDSYGAADGTPPARPSAKKDAPATKETPLSLEGKPGDVRLVVATTTIAARQRWVVPKIPLPPFYQWNQWLDKHEISGHSSLDWMDASGQWWHTEIRGYDQYDPKYRVGEGEFQGTGITIYGVFIVPGRTNPEDQKVILDEKIDCDYRVLEAEARKYGRKDKEHGSPGTNGNGSENVGIGGPAFKPSQNCNTYVHFLLKKAKADHAAPKGAVGWDTNPHFPFSADAEGE